MSDGQVIRGRLRVDARRALSKLREHLLVDPDLYLTELARSFVARGAPRLGLEWDADDILLYAPVPPPKVASIERLLDWLLGGTGSDEDQALRLLALGVNAALGNGPRFVDVYLQSQKTSRIRFSRAVLEGKGPDGLPPLPTVQDAPARPELSDHGVLVHIRKRAGWGVLKRAALGTPHREIELLHASAQDLDVDGLEIPRREPILRARLQLPGLRRGYLELSTEGAGCRFEFLEQGLRLVEQSWQPTGLADVPDVPVGIRAVVDAYALPTNASRSAVSEDSELWKHVHAEADLALQRAVAALTSLVFGTATEQPDVELLNQDRSACRGLLSALVCGVVQASKQGRVVPTALDDSLDLPLLTDAAGTPRSVRQFAFEEAVWVLRGTEAMHADLIPWMQHVLLLSGQLSERCLEGVRMLDGGGEFLERASQGVERRRRWLQHPPLPLSVASSGAEFASESVRIADGALNGLEMQIALLQPPSGRASQIVVWVDERPFETLTFADFPLALSAAVRWSGTLGPNFDFNAMERTKQFHGAIAAVLQRGVYLADKLLGSSSADREARRQLALQALRAIPALERLTHDSAQGIDIERLGHLHRASVWPDVRPSKWWSVQQLAASALSRKSVCIVPTVSTGTPGDDRPVLALSAADALLMQRLLGPDITLVPYARGLRSDAHKAQDNAVIVSCLEQALNAEGVFRPMPRMRFSLPDAEGVISIAKRSVLVELHASVQLARSDRPPHFGARVAVLADNRLVPTPDWTAVHWRPGRYWWRIESQFLCAVLDALEGKASALEAPESVDLGEPLIRSYLLDGLFRLRARLQRIVESGREHATLAESQDLDARIVRIPLLTQLSADGQAQPMCIAELEQANDGVATIPVLRALPGFPTGEFRPLIVPEDGVLQSLRQLFPKLTLADEQLEQARRSFQAQHVLREHLAKPHVDDSAACPLSDSTCPSLRHVPADSEWICGVQIALPTEPLSPGAQCVEVTLQGRHLCVLSWTEFAIPVAARLDVRDVRHVDAKGITTDGRQELGRQLRSAARELLRVVLTSEPRPFEDARVLPLIAALLDPPDADLFGLVEAAPRWPTLQGEPVRLRDAVREDGSVWFCLFDLSPWVHGDPASDLDRPVLRISGTALGKIQQQVLSALHSGARDVSDAAAALFARRRAPGEQVVPRLEGTAPHPRLRRQLVELGVQTAVGEVEVTAGDESSVVLTGLDGVSGRVIAELVIPIQAVLRWDKADDTLHAREALLREIVHAISKYLFGMSGELDVLPAFVRRHLRRLICRRLAREQALLPGAGAAPVFPGIQGSWHAVSELEAGFRYTTLPPPYPERRYRKPILCLDAEEAEALNRTLSGRDWSKQLLRYQAADERRNAPPVAAAVVPDAARSQYLTVVPFEAPPGTSPAVHSGRRGEVAILRPTDITSQRGIDVYVGLRPLCRVFDGATWPLYAIVNDDSLRPNMDFTGASPKKEEHVIAQQVRKAGMQALREHLGASVPAGAPALWLEGVTEDGSTKVVGFIWLPTSYATQPRLAAHVRGALLPDSGCVYLDGSGLDGILPVAGELWIDVPIENNHALRALANERGAAQLAPARREALAAYVLEHAALLFSKSREGFAQDDAEAYAAHLALLGAPLAVALTSASGDTFTTQDVRSRLQQKQPIWYSNRAGSDFGEFPDAEPQFVLEGSHPLVRVLERIAPNSLRELGGVPRPTASDPAFDADVLQAAAQGRPSASPQGESAINGLEQALLDLRLSGDPVARVLAVKSGRPFCYDARSRALLLNVKHPAVAAQLDVFHSDVGARVQLTSAAVAELNRALTTVADSEEQGVLLDMLRSL